MDISNQLEHAKITTDFSGLTQLKAAASRNDPQALKVAAQQFEAIFTQMVMTSMRKANQALGESELLSSDSTKFYENMFDQQLSSSLAHGGGLGLAPVIERQLSKTMPEQAATTYAAVAKSGGGKA